MSTSDSVLKVGSLGMEAQLAEGLRTTSTHGSVVPTVAQILHSSIRDGFEGKLFLQRSSGVSRVYTLQRLQD